MLHCVGDRWDGLQIGNPLWSLRRRSKEVVPGAGMGNSPWSAVCLGGCASIGGNQSHKPTPAGRNQRKVSADTGRAGETGGSSRCDSKTGWARLWSGGRRLLRRGSFKNGQQIECLENNNHFLWNNDDANNRFRPRPVKEPWGVPTPVLCVIKWTGWGTRKVCGPVAEGSQASSENVPVTSLLSCHSPRVATSGRSEKNGQVHSMVYNCKSRGS